MLEDIKFQGDKCDFNPDTYQPVVFYSELETPQRPALLTPYSLFHAFVGMYAFIVISWLCPNLTLQWRFCIWFAAHALFELKDAYKPYTCNSPANSLGDQISAMIGFVAMAYIFPRVEWNFKHIIFGYITIRVIEYLMYEPSGSEQPGNQYRK